MLLALGALWSVPALALPPTHVACVGDSITYGYQASSPSASYPSDLQKMFGSAVAVMNFGHSSATMLSVGDVPYQKQSEYTAATSFVSGAGANAVVAVVVMLGTNDTKSQNWMSGTATRATQFQTDAAAMVDHFAQLATHPTLYLAIPPRAYTNTYGIDGSILQNQIDPILRAVAASKGIATIDLDAPTAGHPELFSDGVHPTDAGYALVAMIVHDALVNGGNGAGGAGGLSGSGGAGGRGGATGGASGSGGMAVGGTGGGSGGTSTGGTSTGGTSTGGASSGGTSTGGTSTGGASTGGVNGGSGGQVTASGGMNPPSSGGTGGAAASTSTGGSNAAASKTSSGGCAVAGDGSPSSGATVLLLGLLVAWTRRRKVRPRRPS